MERKTGLGKKKDQNHLNKANNHLNKSRMLNGIFKRKSESDVTPTIHILPNLAKFAITHCFLLWRQSALPCQSNPRSENSGQDRM